MRSCFSCGRTIGLVMPLNETSSLIPCPSVCYKCDRYNAARSTASCSNRVLHNASRIAVLTVALSLLLVIDTGQAVPIDNSLVGAKQTHECTNSSAVDVVFILDGSGSIGDQSFDQQKRFVSMVVEHLDVSPEGARIAIVQFSDEAKLEIGLGDHADMRSLQWALAKIRYLSGTTFTGNAMDFALKEAFKTARGGNVAKVGVVLTDGQSQDNVASQAESLRNADVLMFAVGVTNLVNVNQLYQITGTPARVFTVDSFERLDRRLAKLITAEMCKFDFQPGVPDIICEADRIGVRARTKGPFEGYVFVKNHFHDTECRQGAEAFSNPLLVGLDIPFTTCDVKRWRSLNPRGIFVETTIVFMFHQLFMTKVDQAVKVQCFYMEADKTVDTPLEVSMLTTEFKDENYPMPTCRYSIRANEPDGPVIRYAAIGQKIFHRWECIEHDSRFDTFGMLVHSCYVDDGAGDRVDLVDNTGCGIDVHLVQTPIYDQTLRVAVREAHIFKYADRPILEFQCQITVCVKYDGECNGVTPPSCRSPTRRNSLSRRPRDLRLQWRKPVSNTMDVLTGQITVLELLPGDNNDHDHTQTSPALSSHKFRGSSKPVDTQQICLSLHTIVIFSVLLAVGNIALLTGVTAFLLRTQNRGKINAVAEPAR